MPYDATGVLDESLLFTSAGMVQFKPYFRGIAEPPSKRLITSQKCMRTGDIDEVGDTTHLTFFEMLGNFSFGDYFKDEAIAYSWEFLTSSEWLGLDPNRLSFTVYETDDEAFECWSTHLREIGIRPETRVFRLGEETNYWPAGAFSAGPPGPCGPNSEMFYWTPKDEAPPSGDYSADDYVRDEKAGKWLEIWNDVFIQYEWQGVHRDPTRPGLGFEKTGMPSLPFRSVDTGMGLERTATVLAGLDSLYDIDIFQAILDKIHQISGQKYGKSPELNTAFRVISDHLRSACFCICDGVLPGNTGRGYVLRRLLRRAILKGDRILGIHKPFLYQSFDGLATAMGDFYPELFERRDLIEGTLLNEEELFRSTLSRGMHEFLSYLNPAFTDEFNQQISEPSQYRNVTSAKKMTSFPGDVAFFLYDSLGFPVEITSELSEEAGLSVDMDLFQSEMHSAQERSRASSKIETAYGGVGIQFDFRKGDPDSPVKTEFVGYEVTSALTHVTGAVPDLDENGFCSGYFGVALEMSPFYTESGGQVSDSGLLKTDDFELEVVDAIRQQGVVVHLCRFISGGKELQGMSSEQTEAYLTDHVFGQEILAKIDYERRRSIARNHTATHLLHAALRSLLGSTVTQAGSLVNENYLRFDFTHSKAVSQDELREIERKMNEQILENLDVITYADIPIAEAKSRGAMALFGEKYGDKVRMVEIGEFSRELCGGTHVGSTGEIGLVRIVSEGSAASGIRRIEAVTGHGANTWISEQLRLLQDACHALKTQPGDLVRAIERAHDQLREEKRKREKLLAEGGNRGAETAISVGSVELVIQKLNEVEMKEAQIVVDEQIKSNPNRVALVGLTTPDSKVMFVAKVGQSAMDAGAHAGNFVRDLAKLCGGGGGGHPGFATSGARDVSKLDDALAAAPDILLSQVS